METQTGIWIDTKKAVIITISEGDKTIVTLNSSIEKRERVPGESKQFGRFRDQYLSFEKNRQNRQLDQAKSFFSEIVNRLGKRGPIVLFGPAQMKFELEKVLSKSRDLSQRVVGVEVADKMTDNQLAAWVRGYFTN